MRTKLVEKQRFRSLCGRIWRKTLRTETAKIRTFGSDIFRHMPLTSYDAYLQIMRDVDTHVHNAMGRGVAWFIRHVCAPCMYKTSNEPRLRFSRLAAMDGNNSLKLVDATFLAGHARPDNRASTSFRWLKPDQVDLFKDEVVNSRTLNAAESDELVKCLDTCVERWKAAGPEACKKMFSFFAVSGIFITVCCHGHAVVMCDMIRSGELMKYPLAMVKRLLDAHGADIGLGYDIGLRYHTGWHPLYVDVVGLEDFEECECTFAKSNHLASTTRLCTPFHRRQTIDEHFLFHDLDKHSASGNFISQNDRQALEKIVTSAGQISLLEAELETTAADYEAYYAAEVQYFQNLCKEPKEVQQTDFENGYTRPQITLVRTRYRTTHTRFLAVEEDLCRYEEERGIETRQHRVCRGAQARHSTYNEAAASLSPPRERLTFAQVIQTTSLAEFDLLRDTRQDIRLLPWTQPSRREAVVLHYGIKRVKEEIQRLY
ncbi:hypothetical protein B0H13DRAFT_2480003 [Mycena leptocephala]|nr:hypothetical protein B0H13DRAFT_2480003 [Mycena leptocephala]